MKLFSSNTVHEVCVSYVLEHLNCRDAKTALKEMHRVLRPGGEVFLAVLDMLSISKLFGTEFFETAMDIIYGVNRPKQDWYPQHTYGYTKITFKNILLEAGFVDIKEFEPFLDDTTKFYLGDTKVSLCLKGSKARINDE